METNIINAFFQENAINPEDKTGEINEPQEKKDETSLLDYLFSIMDCKVELNETVAGYFQKVVLSIYKKKTKEVKKLKI